MSGPVNLPGWVLSIPASLALHAVPIVLLLKLFSPSVQDIFVIDLSERLEVAQDRPQPTESVRRPSGPPASPTKSAPSPPRSEAPAAPSARNEAPAEHSPPAPLATLTPEPAPRLPEPPPALPPVVQPVSLAPPSPVKAPEPMPQRTEPPRQSAPTIGAVVASPPAAIVERDSPAPVAASTTATATRPTPYGTSESASPPSPPTATARVGLGAADARQSNAGPRASTAGGGPGDSTEAEYRAYLALVRQRIVEALRYPQAARQQGLVGTVYLEIVVQPTGVISDVRIVSPSSHSVLDQAALETVRNLPSIGFPPGLAPRQLRARLPVMFNLR
jgi:periplasmic protein TonB